MSNGSSNDHLDLLDDFGFTDPSDENIQKFNTTLLGFTFLIQTFLCLVFNGFSVGYLILCKKYAHDSKYYILTHYFIFKLVFTIVLCVTLLMSSIFEESNFHITPSKWLCKLEFFSNMFMETCENFLLFFIWLIILDERGFIGFKYLNKDNLETEINLQDSAIRTWCHRNSRFIVLGLFYSITGLVTILFSADVEKMNFLGYKKGVCVTKSVASLPIYLLANFPLIFWFILFSTLLWKLFGGTRDPNYNKLDRADKKLIKFIKIASLLRAFEVILIHTQVTFLQLFWKIDFRLVELSRISGFFIILITSILFMYFENVFKRLWSIGDVRVIIHEARENTEPTSESIIYTNLIE